MFLNKNLVVSSVAVTALLLSGYSFSASNTPLKLETVAQQSEFEFDQTEWQRVEEKLYLELTRKAEQKLLRDEPDQLEKASRLLSDISNDEGSAK